MRNITVAIVVGLAVGTAVTPAQAAPPTQDSVQGNVTTIGTDVAGFESATYAIDASSGPSGETPSGTVRATSPIGTFFFEGTVTCLSISDNIALLNLQTGNFGLLALRLTDNAGTGVGDLVEATLTTRSPTECSTPEASYIRHDRVTAGDIVIHDAAPLPSSKEQCRNGGWRNFGPMFKNQGQCVAYVERGPKP